MYCPSAGVDAQVKVDGQSFLDDLGTYRDRPLTEQNTAGRCFDEYFDRPINSCYGDYDIPAGMYLPDGGAFPIECGQGFLCDHGRRFKCHGWTQAAGSKACRKQTTFMQWLGFRKERGWTCVGAADDNYNRAFGLLCTPAAMGHACAGNCGNNARAKSFGPRP